MSLCSTGRKGLLGPRGVIVTHALESSEGWSKTHCWVSSQRFWLRSEGVSIHSHILYLFPGQWGFLKGFKQQGVIGLGLAFRHTLASSTHSENHRGLSPVRSVGPAFSHEHAECLHRTLITTPNTPAFLNSNLAPSMC